MTSRRRTRLLPIAAAAALIGLLATSAAPLLAKDGMEAWLTTPVRLDTPPGTTLTVAWRIVTEDEDGGRVPVTGMPVFLRFVPTGGGEPVEVMGDEQPIDSGRWTGTLVVPAGGIARVEVGMHNEDCENGSCTKSDMLFDLTDDSLVTGMAAGGAAAAVAPRAPAAYTPVQPATVTTSSHAEATITMPLIWLALGLALGLALAVGLVIALGRIVRSPASRA